MSRSRSVDVAGVALALRVWDAQDDVGTPVVLLPGTGSTAGDWDVVAHALRARRTVLAVDLRGHGASAWPGEYSIELMARDVVGLLPRLAPRVDLVGHSLGGLVALDAASRVPGAVRRLVLEDVGIPQPREPRPVVRPAGDLDFDWKVVEQVRPEVDAPDPRWRRVVAGLPMPVLVVAGGAGSPVPQASIADLVATAPDARAVTIEAGHLVHAARPAEFVREVLDFLDEDHAPRT